jgi:hypothetical protein
VQKINGNYYMTTHQDAGMSAQECIVLWHSPDLHKWTYDGVLYGPVYYPTSWTPSTIWTHADVTFGQLNGHALMYYSDTNQVDNCSISVVTDNRDLATIFQAQTAIGQTYPFYDWSIQSPGQILYYNFAQDVGTNIVDSSVCHNNGSQITAFVRSQMESGAWKRTSTAANNGYSSTPDSASLDVSNTFTIEMSVYMTASGKDLAHKWGGSSNSWAMWTYGGSNSLKFDLSADGTTDSRYNGPDVPLNTPVQIDVVYNGTAQTVRFYLNGVFQSQVNGVISSAHVSNIATEIGSGTFQGTFQGDVYRFAMYNTTLTDDQVMGNYKNMKYVYYPNETLTTTTLSANEGGSGTLTVSLSSARAYKTVIHVESYDGTAKAGTDYTELKQDITIPAGQTSGSFVVHLNNVEKYTGNKSFNITLSNPVNATLGENITAEITILDTNTLTFNVSASQTTITESNTTITLTVTKNIISDYPANVTIATADGTATAPADYTAIINQVLTFAPSELTKTVILSIKDNGLGTFPKTFKVALSNPTGNATLGTPHEITITIKEGNLVQRNTQIKGITSTMNMLWLIPLIIIAMFVINSLAGEGIEVDSVVSVGILIVGIIATIVVAYVIVGNMVL